MKAPALFVAAATFLSVATAPAQGTKVGAVDIRAALLRTEDGMSMSATLKRYADRHQNKLDRAQGAIKREEQELKRQMPLLSRRAFQRRYMHYQNRMLSVQKRFFNAEQKLQKKQQNMMSPIVQKLTETVRRAANRRGFDVIVDKSAVPYVRADLDLTDMVVQMYNSGAGSSGDDGDE